MIHLFESAKVCCGIVGAVLVIAVVLRYQTATAGLVALIGASTVIGALDLLQFAIKRRSRLPKTQPAVLKPKRPHAWAPD